jgi:hypothetical protein
MVREDRATTHRAQLRHRSNLIDVFSTERGIGWNMSTSSDLSNLRREPQLERGERRVVQLLETAAVVLAESGYEAATMTEVANRAGASIGTVYQYFPNKEALVQATKDPLSWINNRRPDRAP